MDKDKIVKALCSEYGAKDLKDLENSLGYKIVISNKISWYHTAQNNEMYIFISFKDPLYSSMTRPTTVTILDGSSDEEIVKEFKTRVKYKQSKITKLVKRKEDIIEALREYCSDKFFIGPGIIKDEDVKFTDRERISIRDMMSFDFEATLSKDIVKVYKYPTADLAHELHVLYKFYYGKGIDDITGFKSKKI